MSVEFILNDRDCRHTFSLRDGRTWEYLAHCSDCRALVESLSAGGVTDLNGLPTALTYNPQDWTLWDVAALPVAIDDGTDEPNYTYVVGLKDGRWAAVRGWHDYTGWDCKSDLCTEWYATKDDAIRTLVDWERTEVERKYGATA